MAAKRRRENPLKITVEFTPVVDFDERIRKVWALLLRVPESSESRPRDNTLKGKPIEGGK